MGNQNYFRHDTGFFPLLSYLHNRPDESLKITTKPPITAVGGVLLRG
nr:MAG TPA: hypothetical protein [Caudoviricetes sp.]